MHSTHIPDLIEIPEGDFKMGSLTAQPHSHPSEAPQHVCKLPNFYLAKTPVTNEAYALFLAETDHEAPSHWQQTEAQVIQLDHPIVGVSFDDAIVYCRWLSQKHNHLFDLPTEFQWEKAARGPNDARIYSWGDEWAAYRCNSAEHGRNQTTPVTLFASEQQNPYGIYDMHGNVWEWTRSWYSPYPGSAYRTLKYGRSHRVIRGGSFDNDHKACRISQRGRYEPEVKRPYLGFRIASNAPLAKTPPAPTEKSMSKSRLRQLLAKHFSLSELKNIIYDLELNEDNFTNKIDDMARELIDSCERRGLYTDLMTLVKKERPTLNWEEEKSS